MKFKAIFSIVVFMSSIAFAQKGFRSGRAEEIYFNPQNIGQCVTATSVSQANALFKRGWLPSANGKCAPVSTSIMCGMGGALLQHPSVDGLKHRTSDTCETDQFVFMGWVHAKE